MTEIREIANFIFKREDYCPKLLIISEKKMYFFFDICGGISEKISSRLFFLHNRLKGNILRRFFSLQSCNLLDTKGLGGRPGGRPVA